jgi:pimeloyl-ACP methyl ester carboxylesterase
MVGTVANITCGSIVNRKGDEMNNVPKGDYAEVNGLNMYYEIHGTGEPLLLLHGGFMAIEALGPLLPALAKNRQVIAVELKGHGRTADLDRPLSYEQIAEDVASLLEQLGVEQTDIFGFSLGGMTALRLAVRYPALVRKLVVASVVYSNEGYYPSIVAGWPSMTPETLAGTSMEQLYTQTAPNPKHWPVFVGKVRQALMDFEGWPAIDIQSIKAPTLLMLRDADIVRPEYAVEMFRMLGGAEADGGMGGVPKSQFAVLPGTSHFDLLMRTDLLLSIVTPFLDMPMPGDE